jgi:hypothetical protein
VLLSLIMTKQLLVTWVKCSRFISSHLDFKNIFSFNNIYYIIITHTI